MEDVRSVDRLRPTIARRVLCRRLPFLHRTLRIDAEFWLVLRTALCQRDRHSDHDPGRLLHLVVHATGQAAQDGAGETDLKSARLVLAPGLAACPVPCHRPTTWPCEENPRHSALHPSLRVRPSLPRSAKAAPCGSTQCANQRPPGSSTSLRKARPPPALTRSSAASKSSTLK